MDRTPRGRPVWRSGGEEKDEGVTAVNFEAVKESLLKGIMTKKVKKEDYKTLSHMRQSFVNIF